MKSPLHSNPTSPLRPRQIAVTGGVGCGKSAVARILRQRRIPTLDTDDVARSLLTPDHPVGRRVLREFGPRILCPDGTVDRAALAALVFRDTSDRKRLESILHPEILRVSRAWIRKQKGRRCAVVIPLLHELGLDRGWGWDAIFCVTTRREIALRRLRDRGWSRAESIRRMRVQLPLRVKAARSSHRIPNDGTWKQLETRVQRALGSSQGGERS